MDRAPSDRRQLDTWTDLGSIMGGTGTILAVAGLAAIVLLIRRLWYDAAFVGWPSSSSSRRSSRRRRSSIGHVLRSARSIRSR
jgi:hypothetical protein